MRQQSVVDGILEVQGRNLLVKNPDFFWWALIKLTVWMMDLGVILVKSNVVLQLFTTTIFLHISEYESLNVVSSCKEPHLSKAVSSTDIISYPSFTLSAQINSSGRYPVNTTMMYQCIKDGIHLKEKRILQCLPTGEWNDTILLCNGKLIITCILIITDLL